MSFSIPTHRRLSASIQVNTQSAYAEDRIYQTIKHAFPSHLKGENSEESGFSFPDESTFLAEMILQDMQNSPPHTTKKIESFQVYLGKDS